VQRKVRIRTKIVFIVLVAIIPTVISTLALAIYQQRSYIDDRKDTITHLCFGYENEQRLIVRNAEEMMLAISRTQAVLDADYPAINEYLRNLMQVYPDYAVLLLTDDQATVVASGVNRTGYSLADRAYMAKAMDRKVFTIGDFVIGRSTGVPSISFVLPLRDRNGRYHYLVSSYSLAKYSRELSLNRLGPDETLEICDAKGIRLFSAGREVTAEIGKTIDSSLFLYASSVSLQGVGAVSLGDRRYLVASEAYTRNGNSLYLTVRVPYDHVLSESFRPAVLVAGLMLLACLSALLLSIRLANRLIVSRVESLTAYTREVSAGNLGIRSDINSSRDELTELMESFNTMAESLEDRRALMDKALTDREAMLIELQRRVSDNLQLLSSMISLQIGHCCDDQTIRALMTTHSRVMTLALVYETLYRYSDVQEVSMQKYCAGLFEFLLSQYAAVGTGIACSCSGIDALLPIEKALPLALILNEVVSNSLQHAFPEGAQGSITVSIERNACGGLKITMSDTGSGFSGDLESYDTLGFEIVRALVSQLRGTITVRTGVAGTNLSLLFTEL